MKLLCLLALTACVISPSVQVPSAILSSDTVEGNFKNTQYDLIVAPFEESEKHGEDMIEIYKEPDSINSVIQAILDRLKDFIENGSDAIPSVDPLFVGQVGPVELETNTSFTGNLTIHELTILGLSKYEVERINLNPLRLTAGIGFVNRNVTSTGRYEAISKAGIVTLTGEGDLEFVADNCEMAVDMIMGVNTEDMHLYLKELDIHISIKDIQIKIFNQTGSPLINNLISVAIQTASQTFVQTQLPFISKFLRTYLFNIINNILKEFTVKDIFG